MEKSPRVERVFTALPHAQVIVTMGYTGWMPDFMVLVSRVRVVAVPLFCWPKRHREGLYTNG